MGIITVFVLLPVSSTMAREYSATSTGFLGLNTVPSARMGRVGDVRIGTAFADPYMHGYFGVQVAEPLFINLRQSAEGSNPFKAADRLYPGMDIKLRLWEETAHRPQVAIGMQSVIGHKQMAGEFIAASKRWNDFDFTLGAGWGRFGTAAHTDNPLKGLFSHFGKNRGLDGEIPNGLDDWFTGEDIGFFGGVEYFTHVKGLSVKVDYGADRYTAERDNIGFDAPPPWSVGLSYTTPNLYGMYANIGVAAQGTDRIMARLNLGGNLKDWRDSVVRKRDHNYAHLNRARTDIGTVGAIDVSALNEGLRLYHTRMNTHDVETNMVLDPYTPLPHQLGRAVIHMGNNSPSKVESFGITPTVMGLRGPEAKLIRSGFERALTRGQGSAEEIWQTTTFDTSGKWLFWEKLKRPAEENERYQNVSLVLDNKVSLAEEDSGGLYRSSLVGGFHGPRMFGFLDTGAALRVNLHDNLGRMRSLRPAALLPVRSDEDRFADRRVALDQSWLALTHSFRTDLHVSLMGGYLEEMYAGLGGEVLYRPFKSRFAVGAQAFQALKRDPLTTLNLGLSGDNVFSAHINAWYDIPHPDITAHVKVGRYLNEDTGVTAGLMKRFENGITLDAFVGVTNAADYDLLGGTTHVYNGLRLSLPLNGYTRGLKYAPDNVAVKFAIMPFGRDNAQVIDNPIPLYELTETFTYKHISDHWHRVVAY